MKAAQSPAPAVAEHSCSPLARPRVATTRNSVLVAPVLAARLAAENG
jgi:hypothetical protein